MGECTNLYECPFEYFSINQNDILNNEILKDNKLVDCLRFLVKNNLF